MSLRPAQALLDPQNPRLPDGTTSDREAINRLLDEGADALINLARDMAQSGQSNPAELPIAMREGSKYLVLEGNRRFAALKLLKDPRLADSEQHQQAFRRAAALGTPPKSVYTLIVGTREEADRWIVFRHTGENNGRGTKRWSAGEAATYRSRANKSIDSGTMRSMVIFEELSDAYAEDSEIQALLQDVRSAPTGRKRSRFTNIGRFFSPDVLSRLRLHIHSDEVNGERIRTLWSNYSAAQMRGFFEEALRFIKNQSVDAFKNEDKRKLIIDSLEYLLPGSDSALTTPVRLGASRAVIEEDDAENNESNGSQERSEPRDENSQDETDSSTGEDTDKEESESTGSDESNDQSSSQHDAKEAKKTAREPKPEKYLLQGLKLPNHNRRIRDLVAEARALEIATAPGVCCVMIRVIVELSVSSAEALALSGKKEDDALKKKIIGVLSYLDPNIENPRQRDKLLDQAYLEASDLGFQYMNSFVHNPNVRPDEQLARRFSSAFRPLLTQLDEALS